MCCIYDLYDGICKHVTCKNAVRMTNIAIVLYQLMQLHTKLPPGTGAKPGKMVTDLFSKARIIDHFSLFQRE